MSLISLTELEIETGLQTTNMAGSNLGLIVLINHQLSDQQRGLGLNNFFGEKVKTYFQIKSSLGQAFRHAIMNRIGLFFSPCRSKLGVNHLINFESNQTILSHAL